MRRLEKRVPFTRGFMSETETMNMFKKFDKETWQRCGNSYEILKTNKIFANGAEIELSSAVFLFNDMIVFCEHSLHQKSIFLRQLKRKYIYKIGFLDNTEKKGAALVLLIYEREMSKKVLSWVTPETTKYYDYSSNETMLIIPMMNSDEKSVEKVKQRLHTFSLINNNNSPTGILYIIKYSEFEACIKRFKLKSFIYNSNENSKTPFIVIMKNNYSIGKSITILRKFLSKVDKPTINIDDNFNIIKNDDILETYLNDNIFGSKNVDTDEMYYVNGRAFYSLFYKNWLHCDIIDSYLNEWRTRLRRVFDNPFNTHKPRIKIFNTFLYTRLTRKIVITSSKTLSKHAFEQLHENVNRISREKVYHSSKSYISIFDFDVLVFPIHTNDHWITGIVYQPKNCLVEINGNNDASKKDKNNTRTVILIFDSLSNIFTFDKYFCNIVLKEYVKACHISLKKNYPEKNFRFDENKVKIAKLEDPYHQKNGYDCGLFMLEFIRQVMINPMSIQKLIENESMTKVFSTFNANLSRNYLKSFVYSKVELKKWNVLYEMEQFYLTYHHEMKFTRRRSNSF